MFPNGTLNGAGFFSLLVKNSGPLNLPANQERLLFPGILWLFGIIEQV
jgi:hypothetical protein